MRENDSKPHYLAQGQVVLEKRSFKENKTTLKNIFNNDENKNFLINAQIIEHFTTDFPVFFFTFGQLYFCSAKMKAL